MPEWWPTGSRVSVVLAHGGGSRHDDPFVEGLQRRLTERRYSRCASISRSPRRASRDRTPSAVLQRTFRSAVGVLGRDPSAAPAHLFIGGIGIGAQAAAHAAASRLRVDGLFLLGYPLHSRDQPDKNVRAEALFRIVAPMLFVQGTRDRTATSTRCAAP
jgi:predicted alpha/beta-hydrolase family hydrolase